MASALWRISRFVRKPPPIPFLTPRRVQNHSTLAMAPQLLENQMRYQEEQHLHIAPFPVLRRKLQRRSEVSSPKPTFENNLFSINEDQLELLGKVLARDAECGDVLLLQGY